ncbi:MAG: hypothetical protein NPIRA02_04240 [Nitrospirales bacterium]|nr:MAG: hypothetical protein NPIRA02_04240 [Nitrospirales bacterium]
MNVAFDPWIPVVNTSGKRELTSLCTVLTEGNRFADLAVRPHERVSLMRLFLCIAHTALNGPKDYKEWLEVPNRIPEEGQKYLKTWKDSFELYHKEKPWLQVAELKEVTQEKKDKEEKKPRKKKENGTRKTSPVALLDFELATGNNSTLYDHDGQKIFRDIAPERVALNLLTFQNFSPGGGSPVAQWKSKKTLQVGNPDAPCLSQSMAHCLFRGRSLAETLHLNLPTFDTIRMIYKSFSSDKKGDNSCSEGSLGKPVWEFFPESPEMESGIDNATKTYIGRLVPVSRWIRLIHSSDQMYCCNGFKYDTYKDGFPAEPTAAVRSVIQKDKKGGETKERQVVKADPTKALWRELSALLIKRAANGLGGPLAMDNAPQDATFDCHVCAMIRDQASMDIAIESVFHITPAFQLNLSIYQTEVEKAEEYSRKLRWAVEDYRLTLDADWKSRVEKRTEAKGRPALKNRLAQTALLSYWTTVEKQVPLLMTHIDAVGTEGAISTREAWRKMLFSAACDAYKVACGQETPRQMRAFAKGRQKLMTKKSNPESDSLGIMEVNDELAS